MNRLLQVVFGVVIIQVSSYVVLTDQFLGFIGFGLAWIFFFAPIIQVARDYDDLVQRKAGRKQSSSHKEQ